MKVKPVRDVNGAVQSDEPITENEEITEEEGTLEEEEVSPKSLRETIESGYDSLAEKEAHPETREEKAERLRDESGKFTKAEGKTPEVETPLTPPAGTPAAEGQQAPTSFNPPQSLSPENAAIYKQLPPQLQEAFNKMENGYYRTVSKPMGELGIKERRYRDLDDVVAPYEVEWAKAGVSPGQVLNNYLAWEKDFHANPHKVIGELLAQKGLSVESLLENKDQLPNPEVLALQKRIEELEGGQTQARNQSIADYNQSLNNEIENYAREVGADGQPLRPHFDEVYKYMIPVARAYREANPEASERQILDAAYRDAIYLNPQVRQKLLDEEANKRAADLRKAESEKVQRARVAGSSLSGTATGQTMVNKKPTSLRDTILNAWDELS